MKLDKLKCIVTGGSMGLGRAICDGFRNEGARVLECSRSYKAIRCDVSDQEDVRLFFNSSIYALSGLDVLVCNAGIYGPIGELHEVSVAEWKQCIEVNLYGVVHCCRTAIPYFIKQKKGKIIIIAGGGATKPMPNFTAYAASKAAVVRFAESLALELRPHNIDVNCVAPGALNTRFLDQVLAAKENAGEEMAAASLKQKDSGGDSMERAVALAIFLASSDSDGITGKLISAKWDDWSNLDKERLMGSDLFTLRRVIE